jgi:hypothetical protein
MTWSPVGPAIAEAMLGTTTQQQVYRYILLNGDLDPAFLF